MQTQVQDPHPSTKWYGDRVGRCKRGLKWGWGVALIGVRPGVLAGLVLVTAILSTPVYAAQSVYVTNNGSDDISQFTLGADATLLGKSPAFVDAPWGPEGIVVSPNGKSVYVATQLSDDVSQYSVGASGGLFNKTPAFVGAGTDPTGIATSPDGQYVYVANQSSDDVSQFEVVAGGKLSAIDWDISAGTSPIGIAVSPDGKSAYVTNNGSDDVSQFDVGMDGSLSPKAADVSAGTGPKGIAISPDGKTLYVTNESSDNVSQYSVGLNGVIGAPTNVGAGVAPTSIAISPDGESAYVTNQVGNNISQYNVGADGTLSEKAAAKVAFDGPSDIVISSDGKAAFATNEVSNEVARFIVNNDGTLSSFPTDLAVGAAPTSVAITPAQSPSPQFSISSWSPGGFTDQANLLFDASSSKNASTYKWDFGDGQSSTDAKVYHKFAVGTYAVTMNVGSDECAADAVFVSDVVSTGRTAYCNGPRTKALTYLLTVSKGTVGGTPGPTPAHPIEDLPPGFRIAVKPEIVRFKQPRLTRIDSKGFAVVQMNCTWDEDCLGQLNLQTTEKFSAKSKRGKRRMRRIKFGEKSFSIPSRTVMGVRVKISKDGLRLLKNRGKISVSASAKLVSNEAEKNPVTATFTLQSKKKGK